MKIKSDLFNLIQSLTKPEKRFFRMSASRQGGMKNYLKLFDAIEKQTHVHSTKPVYSEQKLRAILKGEKFISNLSFEKNYLYRQLLRCLNDFHHEGSVDLLLKSRLINLHVLQKKSLFSQADELLAKTKELAWKYEKLTVLLELLSIERKRVADSFDPAKMEKFIPGFREEFVRVIDLVQTHKECEHIQNVIYLSTLKHYKSRTREEQDALLHILQKELPALERKPLSYDSKRLLYNSYVLYYTASGENEKRYAYSNKLFDLIESNPHRARELPNSYIYSLTGLMVSEVETKRKEAFFRTMKKLDEIPGPVIRNLPEDSAIPLFGLGMSIRLDGMIRFGEFSRGLSLAKKVEAGLTLYGTKLSSTLRAILCSNLSILHFSAGDFATSRKWMNALLNDTTLQSREDIQCFARIFNLIIHYELGNSDLLEHIVKSTYRFLSKRNRLYRLESVVLAFLRRSQNYTTPGMMKEGFQFLKEELIPLEKDPFEKNAFDYFNYIAWLESKITGMSFEDSVRKRMEEENPSHKP